MKLAICLEKNLKKGDIILIPNNKEYSLNNYSNKSSTFTRKKIITVEYSYESGIGWYSEQNVLTFEDGTSKRYETSSNAGFYQDMCLIETDRPVSDKSNEYQYRPIRPSVVVDGRWVEMDTNHIT